MKRYHPKQYVELFHILFINQLNRKIDKKLYAIKGGCNMRFYFNSIRYSEDIDIDIQTIAKETLTKNVNLILESTPFKIILKNYGLEILSTNVSKQTSTTQRWKLSLKADGTALPIHTKIEFSRRNFSSDVSYDVIKPDILNQYSITPIMGNHYNFQQMYEQKIIALALRAQVQSRDIFDLYFLLNAGIKKQPVAKTTFQYLPQAIKNAGSVTYADFKGQVVSYLEEIYQDDYSNEMAWENILAIVIKALEKEVEKT